MAASHDSIEIPAYVAAIFDQAPLPLSVYDRHGTQIAINDAHVALWNIRREEWIGRFNMVTDPQLAAMGNSALFQRVMQGETVVVPPHLFNAMEAGFQEDAGAQRWVEATYFPLRDANGDVTHLAAILRDVTRETEQSQAIAVAQAEIASQQAMIETLSSPVVQVWQGILTVPIVGSIDSRRAIAITENLLHTITRQRAQCVILDITAVPIVDTRVAQYLIDTAHACRLLGCDAVLVGIGVEIAQTLVQLGVDLTTLVTLANLQAGVAWAFARRRLRVVDFERTPGAVADVTPRTSARTQSANGKRPNKKY
ncbi:MAG: STAS domain-containing protein [Roseiflexaceae bacterium]